MSVWLKQGSPSALMARALRALHRGDSATFLVLADEAVARAALVKKGV
jgi:hypothetical protein